MMKSDSATFPTLNRKWAHSVLYTLILGIFSFSSLVFALDAADEESEFIKARNLKTSNPQEALEKLRTLANANGDLKEYVLFEMSELVPEKEQETIYSEILTMNPNLLLRLTVIHKLANLYIDSKRSKLAISIVNGALKRSRGSELYPKLVLSLLRANLETGNSSQVCQYFSVLFTRHAEEESLNMWNSDPNSWTIAKHQIKCHISNEKMMTRWKNLILKGFKVRAEDEWKLVEKRWDSESQYQADLVRFSFLNAESNFLKAFELLKTHFAQKKSDPKYLTQLAYSAARIGQGATAVGLFARVKKIAPESREGRESFFQSGFFQYLFQDYDGADRIFNEYIQQKRAPRRKEAEWYLAWMKYLRNDPAGAEKSLQDLLQHTKDIRVREKLLYWRAVSLIKLENSKEGEKILEALAADPFSYYGIAAMERLRNLRGGDLNITSLKSQKDALLTGGANTEAETDQEEAKDKEPTENQDELASIETSPTDADEVFSDAVIYRKLNRAKSLTRLGLQDWARWDLWDVEKKSKSSEQLKRVMRDYQTYGFFNRSSQMAHLRFMQERISSGLDNARPLWELAYPRAYMSYIKDNSSRFEVPPYLIWAIMKQESQFKQDARSNAGAIGLLQIMPFTGVKLAGLLKEPGFTPQSLLDPNTNIRLGTKYLSRLSERFSQVVPLVAAAYNAGPHRVLSWMSHFGFLTTDEFIEHIPFSETRIYVKKVMENMWTYEQLYGKKDKIFPYLAQSLPVNVTKGFYVAEYWDSP